MEIFRTPFLFLVIALIFCRSRHLFISFPAVFVFSLWQFQWIFSGSMTLNSPQNCGSVNPFASSLIIIDGLILSLKSMDFFSADFAPIGHSHFYCRRIIGVKTVSFSIQFLFPVQCDYIRSTISHLFRDSLSCILFRRGKAFALRGFFIINILLASSLSVIFKLKTAVFSAIDFATI